MRSLKRDKRLVLVSFFGEKVAVRDNQGRLTGKHEVLRSTPIPFYATISAAKGETENTVFGTSLDYDKSLVFDNTSIPISENDVLWIDNVDASVQANVDDSSFTGDLTEGKSHDYTIKRIAKSPNCITVAVTHIETKKNAKDNS